jgi:hypothetical protein
MPGMTMEELRGFGDTIVTILYMVAIVMEIHIAKKNVVMNSLNVILAGQFIVSVVGNVLRLVIVAVITNVSFVTRRLLE